MFKKLYNKVRTLQRIMLTLFGEHGEGTTKANTVWLQYKIKGVQ